MKNSIVSLFLSAALICGVSAMAQNTTKPAEKAKAEVKTECAKEAKTCCAKEAKTCCAQKACSQKDTKVTNAKTEKSTTTQSTAVKATPKAKK